MDFDEYQEFTTTTDRHVSLTSAGQLKAEDLVISALGVNGEAGEVAEKVKKLMRDNGGIVDDADRTAVALELGDVLWYVATMATKLGLPFSDVARLNIAKLTSRRERGTLHGSGDNR